MSDNKAKVIFNNGKEIEIPQSIANLLCKKILEGAAPFQTYSTNEGEANLIINLNQISCVVNEEKLKTVL